MAITLAGTTVTWNDGTTNGSSSPTQSIITIDTQKNTRPITTFAIGTYQLCRTSGFPVNNSQGGSATGAWYLNSQTCANWGGYGTPGATSVAANSAAPYVVASSTVTNDYNYVWYSYAGINPSTSTVGQCAGTWWGRGQMYGRGITAVGTQNHGNFVLLQRVA